MPCAITIAVGAALRFDGSVIDGPNPTTLTAIISIAALT